MINRFQGPDGKEHLIRALINQLIAGGDESLAARIAEECTIAIYEAGSEIIRQGDSGDELFLLIGGSVAIVVHGREIAERISGQHVGEMGLINPGTFRSASVVAIEQTITARISEASFTKLAEETPAMWRRLASDLGKRVRQYNEYETQLEFVAHHDSLTLLPNRNLFTERFHQAILRARRTSGECAVLYLDLDRFKPVNDTHGHAIGDHLLKQVADRIKSCVRKTDTVARFGGDEFLILLVGIGIREDANTVAQKLVDSLARPFLINDIELSISVSIGIAFYPDHGDDVETLMQRADSALYEAKRAGRDNFRLCE